MKKQLIFLAIALIGQLVLAQISYPPAGQSTYVINSGQTITVTDGQSITFGPGVHIKSGAIFSARIAENTTANDPYVSVGLSDENYVFTRNYQRAMTGFTSSGTLEGDVYEDITYFDGLGRPMQQLAIKASPTKKDILTHVGYDQYGRMTKEWLPTHETGGTMGTYRGNRESATQSYYKSNYASDFTSLSTANVNAYSEKDIEPSPLNRVLKQAAPGQDWRLGAGHEIEFAYQANSATEVRYLYVDFISNNPENPSLKVGSGADQYYGEGELLKSVTKDENHDGSSSKLHTTEEFTDKLGRTILKRTYALVNNAETAHDTYYVYDEFGNLTYVVPPKVTTSSISSAELNDLCYQYRYDNRNRLIEKKLPGKGWEFIVYNKLDQPIMTQDANLDGDNKWLFTKYDPFGRVAYTGMIYINSSRASLQNNANNTSIQYEQRNTTSTLDGITVYYSNSAYPSNSLSHAESKLLTVNYYDSYVDTDGLSVPSTILNQPKATNTQGLATVSKVRVLETDDWITTITGYDNKGRPIYSASKNNYLNTTDIAESEIDYGGKTIRSKTTHQRTGHPNIVTEDNFTYDHVGRLLKQKQTINGQAVEVLAENTYDNLGQLEKKEVGGGLQTVDYEYNVRGWLKSINKPGNLGNDLFAFEIRYNNPSNFGGNENPEALYNGNISQTYWDSATNNATSNPVSERYSYSYDAMNRITSAFDNTNNYSLSLVEYDKNGNIEKLARRGAVNTAATSFNSMDNLTYEYNGNRLNKITEINTKSYGFKSNYTGTGNQYYYDDNGNMVRDLNKNLGTTGVDGITYNHLNLPSYISNSSTNRSLQYKYDATGTKIEKYYGGAGISPTTTEYANGYVYQNGVLQFFGQPEGYVTSNGNGGYSYIYQYRDNLDNIRLTYIEDPSISGQVEVIEENNYYPFGLEHKGYNIGGDVALGNDMARNYKYNGIELEEGLGLEDYEMDLRRYNPSTGRWNSMDPVVHPSLSPYNAFDNNPVFWADPSGADSWTYYGGTYLNNVTGETTTDWRRAVAETVAGSSSNNQEEADGISSGGCDDCSLCPEACTQSNNSSSTRSVSKYPVSVDYEGTMEKTMMAAVTIAKLDGQYKYADGVAGAYVLNTLFAIAIAQWTADAVNDGQNAILLAYDANWLYAKQEKDIQRLLTKEGGPPGMTYALTVNVSGTYPSVRGEMVYLNAGDVWKYGKTTLDNRYTQKELDGKVPGGVTLKPLFFGTDIQIRIQEKIMIYGHALATGKLPPGNHRFY